jgi:hypothetical protein
MYLRASTSLLLLSLMGVSTAWTQSLADVARQEEARRKSIEARGKVYTNQDLNEVPPPTTPAAKHSGASRHTRHVEGREDDRRQGKGQGQRHCRGQKKEVPKDQAYWSDRMKALQIGLERDQIYADALQSRINALSLDFVNRDDPAQRALIAADRNKATAELERLKQGILDDKKAIGDLEEEARRASVPPGWLR